MNYNGGELVFVLSRRKIITTFWIMQILLSKNLVLSIHRFAYTVDYTGGEEVRANLLKGRSSAKPEAHESLAHG
jgi:hypothetical protein